jgi:hypothetical protein
MRAEGGGRCPRRMGGRLSWGIRIPTTNLNLATGTYPFHSPFSSPPLHPKPPNHPPPTTSIYISGDTLLVPELNEIPKRYAGQNIDLMLIHLGGTTIPSPSVPLLMVTMDAEQGVKLVRLIGADVVIPVHYEYVASYPFLLQSLLRRGTET